MTKRVLILGGHGYVGSRLQQVLNQHYTVDVVDTNWYNTNQQEYLADYHDLPKDYYADYNVIIVLAGHSSVKSCEGPIKGPWLNNVSNFEELLTKVSSRQLVIYASSASVYGNSRPGERHAEGYVKFTPVNNYDITKYALDLAAQAAITRGKQVVGLRFGTVNGCAPVLRTDVMINAMYRSAVEQNQITVTNRHISRAILGLEDLCRAVNTIIETPRPGIYNLASFNYTVREIAESVGERLSVPVIDNGVTDGVYDFAIDCSLFKAMYGFVFEETPVTIVDGLIKGYADSQVGRRDQYITYDWDSNGKL